MAGEHPGDVEALGKPPGWTHPRAMRDYIRKIGAFDRDLHKEVAKINKAERMVQEIQSNQLTEEIAAISGPLPAGTSRLPLISPITEKKSTPVFDYELHVKQEKAWLESITKAKPMDSNKTGFGGFKSIFGEGLGNLKKIASDLDEEMRSVVAEGQQVAESGKQITEAARREIAEARAALAQFSNGGPSE